MADCPYRDSLPGEHRRFVARIGVIEAGLCCRREVEACYKVTDVHTTCDSQTTFLIQAPLNGHGNKS